jgi:membrane protein DedA with SNARE-associated domain
VATAAIVGLVALVLMPAAASGATASISGSTLVIGTSLAQPTLASIFTVAEDIGYPLLFLIVMIETGCGVPFAPGELATVTAGIVAADHKLQIEAVIAVAAAGAIVGDNIGYLIGRAGGRRLLERSGPFARQRRRALEMADPFFDRHGSKAVFFGRWLPVLRVYASWMAGASRMRWRTFAVWNAAGGICWATSMGLLGYFGGAGAKSVINDFGRYGLVVFALGLTGGFLLYRHYEGRRLRALSAKGEADESRRAPAEPPV